MGAATGDVGIRQNDAENNDANRHPTRQGKRNEGEEEPSNTMIGFLRRQVARGRATPSRYLATMEAGLSRGIPSCIMDNRR